MIDALNLETRQFGKWFELTIQLLNPTFKPSDDLSYDRKDNDIKIEIKASRALSKATEPTIDNYHEVGKETKGDRLICDDNKLTTKWDCNIQQIKTDCFDILWYGIFFQDKIYIFKIDSETIRQDSNIKYSDKQHRGNKREGQFHIKNTNIQYHIDNYLYMKLDYDDLKKLT